MAFSTDTYVYRMGTAPNTRAAVSQKNKVFSYSVGKNAFTQLGALSEFGFDESRAVDPYRGVGYGDMIAELVPGVTEPMSLTVNKTLLYTANLFQLFGYKGGMDGLVRSLKHHRWPFDIKQELVFSEAAMNETLSSVAGTSLRTPTVSNTGPTGKAIQVLLTFYEGCWMQGYNASFASDSAIVQEGTTVVCSDVIDGFSTYGEYIDTGLAPGGGGAAAGKGSSIRFSSATTPAAIT